MMPNFAAEVKKQTDKILRQQKIGPDAGVTITGGSGGGIVVNPSGDLARHKTSADHDGRYYTESEIDGKLNFLTLTDTPDAYTSQGGKIVAVKADVSGLEFVAAPAAENGIPVGGTENQLAAKNSNADYDVKWMDAPAAANGLPAGGSSRQILQKKSASDYDTEWVAKGLERWCVPAGTNLGYDDEFDDGAIDADWIAVDVPSYANSWYEPAGLKGLSVSVPSGKGAWKYLGLLRPLSTLTPPLYIETAVMLTGESFITPSAGIMFADGTTYGSGQQVGLAYSITSNYLLLTDISGFNVRDAIHYISLGASQIMGRIYLRLYWSATNTFYAYFSADGVTWVDAFGAKTITITPTYFGLLQSSNDNSTYPYVANYAYFRVRSGSPANG